MSRLRLAFFAAVSALALVALLVACVGDDPATSAPTTGDGGTPPAPPPNPPNPPPPPPPLVDGGNDAGQHFCQTKTTPPGATDYFCADFDEGADASAGWTSKELDDGGVLQVDTSVASSPPNSVTTKAVMGSPVFGGGALTFHAASAKSVTQMVLRADMNPATLGGVGSLYTGHVTMLQLNTSDVQVALEYTRGGNVPMPASKTNYTGYYVTVALTGGAAVILGYDAPTLLTQLPANQWRTVQLTYIATSTGEVKVDINGVNVFDKTNVGITTDTSATAQVGEIASGDVQQPEAMRYDNVEVAVTRAP